MSEVTELIELPPKETALAVYSADNGLEPFLAKIRAEIESFTPDISTKKGRDAVASIAHKVAKSKVALDNIGKELVAELKELPKKVDAERKRMRDTLDAWRDEVRQPLTEWEQAEKERVNMHEDAIDWLRNQDDQASELTSGEIKQRIKLVEAVDIGLKWQEFEAEAARTKDVILLTLRTALATSEKQEAEQAELVRLRAEAAERERKDHEARIAQEAADRAKQEAEARAKEAAAAAAKAAADAKAASERRELELRLQAETAERERLEVIQKAEKEKADAIARAEQVKQDAEDRQRQAVEAERKRQADEAARVEAETKKREADQQHRINLMGEAKQALMSMNITEDLARAIVLKIVRGEVPNIQIHF